MQEDIVNTTQKYTRIIVQIINDPTSYFREIFLFKFFNEIIYRYITKGCKNASVNLTTNGISLTFIKNTSPVGGSVY